jgi:aldehyde:ferredoxin oxidoreductase
MADGLKKHLYSQETWAVLDEYYEARGWDKESGLPTMQKLQELGLDDVASDLQKRGFIPR